MKKSEVIEILAAMVDSIDNTVDELNKSYDTYSSEELVDALIKEFDECKKSLERFVNQ